MHPDFLILSVKVYKAFMGSTVVNFLVLITLVPSLVYSGLAFLIRPYPYVHNVEEFGQSDASQRFALVSVSILSTIMISKTGKLGYDPMFYPRYLWWFSEFFWWELWLLRWLWWDKQSLFVTSFYTSDSFIDAYTFLAIDVQENFNIDVITEKFFVVSMLLILVGMVLVPVSISLDLSY